LMICVIARFILLVRLLTGLRSDQA
jgi:hypothetical protein